MSKNIQKRIVRCSVVKPEAAVARADAGVVQMHEKLEQPERLLGSTYKLKAPLSDHALYVNDIVLKRRHRARVAAALRDLHHSKNMDHFQWIVALTRIMSAVFRKGGDVTFLVEEFVRCSTPRGGIYFWSIA